MDNLKSSSPNEQEGQNALVTNVLIGAGVVCILVGIYFGFFLFEVVRDLVQTSEAPGFVSGLLDLSDEDLTAKYGSEEYVLPVAGVRVLAYLLLILLLHPILGLVKVFIVTGASMIKSAGSWNQTIRRSIEEISNSIKGIGQDVGKSIDAARDHWQKGD